MPESEPIRRKLTAFDHILSTKTAETLVGGAGVSTGILAKALTLAPRLVAVDGGANTLFEAGLMPERVVGDMDSIAPHVSAAFEDRLDPIAEQDSTDFGKALRTSEAEFIVAVGFIGARVDHFLACLSDLACQTSFPPCILLGDEDCVCILPPDATLSLPVGTRVSLWPLGRATGTSTGLKWPINDITFEPAGRVGTSNEAAEPEVTLTVDGGPMALLLPAAHVEEMLGMLKIAPRSGTNLRL